MAFKKRISSKTSQKGKKQEISSSKDRKKNGGTLSLYVTTYEIIYEPMQDEYTKLVPPEIEDEMNNELYDLTMGNPEKAIDRLNQLKQQYPNYPRVYNYLSVAYSLLRDTKKLYETVEENYRKTPDYLFAKVNYAETCLDRGEVDKIPAIFDNKFDLKLLYPDRNEFHVSEAISFFGLLCDYYMAIGNLEQARHMLQTLKRIDPDNENTQILETKLKIKEMN